jgi:hypothetical protein
MQIPMNVAQWGCDPWALKVTHSAKLTKLSPHIRVGLVFSRDGTADSNVILKRLSDYRQ